MPNVMKRNLIIIKSIIVWKEKHFSHWIFLERKNELLSWIYAQWLSGHLWFKGQQKLPVAGLNWNPCLKLWCINFIPFDTVSLLTYPKVFFEEILQASIQLFTNWLLRNNNTNNIRMPMWIWGMAKMKIKTCLKAWTNTLVNA